MRWFSLKMLATCAVALGACSDDGVLLNGGDTDAADTGGPGGTMDPSAGSAAVTTASGTDTEGSDSETATTDPTDATDSNGTTTGDETDSGPIGTSGSSTDTDSGGSSGGSSTGGTVEPECVVDEDCMVVNDCCTCDAIPLDEDAPKCDVDACLQPTCAAIGLGKPDAECNFGVCELEEVSCNPMLVTCDEKAPVCPEGAAPRVIDGCWAGCVQLEYCDVVPGCDACGEEEACIENIALPGPTFTCVPIALECDGAPSCDCMGEACEEPFDSCSDDIDPKSGSELSCTCIAC